MDYLSVPLQQSSEAHSYSSHFVRKETEVQSDCDFPRLLLSTSHFPKMISLGEAEGRVGQRCPQVRVHPPVPWLLVTPSTCTFSTSWSLSTSHELLGSLVV